MLADFRDDLMAERNLPENRVQVDRRGQGRVLVKRDGSMGVGPYTMAYPLTCWTRQGPSGGRWARNSSPPKKFSTSSASGSRKRPTSQWSCTIGWRRAHDDLRIGHPRQRSQHGSVDEALLETSRFWRKTELVMHQTYPRRIVKRRRVHWRGVCGGEHGHGSLHPTVHFQLQAVCRPP